MLFDHAGLIKDLYLNTPGLRLAFENMQLTTCIRDLIGQMTTGCSNSENCLRFVTIPFMIQASLMMLQFSHVPNHSLF